MFRLCVPTCDFPRMSSAGMNPFFGLKMIFPFSMVRMLNGSLALIFCA